MPLETLEIGHGSEQSRLARAWSALAPWARWALTVLAAVVVVSAGAVVVTHVHATDADRVEPSSSRRTRDAMRPPPWVLSPRYTTEPAFALVNRTNRRIFVSTPPRFVFTVEPHQRLLFARAPVCTYQRFTARFRHGPPIGTIRHFCSASRWVVLRSGTARLDAG